MLALGVFDQKQQQALSKTSQTEMKLVDLTPEKNCDSPIDVCVIFKSSIIHQGTRTFFQVIVKDPTTEMQISFLDSACKMQLLYDTITEGDFVTMQYLLCREVQPRFKICENKYNLLASFKTILLKLVPPFVLNGTHFADAKEILSMPEHCICSIKGILLEIDEAPNTVNARNRRVSFSMLLPSDLKLSILKGVLFDKDCELLSSKMTHKLLSLERIRIVHHNSVLMNGCPSTRVHEHQDHSPFSNFNAIILSCISQEAQEAPNLAKNSDVQEENEKLKQEIKKLNQEKEELKVENEKLKKDKKSTMKNEERKQANQVHYISDEDICSELSERMEEKKPSSDSKGKAPFTYNTDGLVNMCQQLAKKRKFG